MGKKIYVIDGMSICYRSFFALKGLSTRSGFPTNAIYGFVNMLRKLFKMFKVEAAVVCFDTPAKTFRQEEYSEYKIQRPPMPEDLSSQIGIIKKIISLWGIEVIEKDGFEADDLIAAVAKKAAAEGYEVVAVTQDKDMLQIVKDRKVMLYNIYKGEFIDEDYVRKHFAVDPCRIPDFLALVGDATDNIPGVKGIGPKAAFSLMKKFGSISNLLANLEEVPLRQRRLIAGSKKEMELSLQLATLKADVGIDINIKDFAVKPADYKALAKIFEELEFNSFLKEITSPSSRPADVNYAVVTEEELRQSAKKNGYVVFLLQKDKVCFCSRNKVCEIDVTKAKSLLEDASLKKAGYSLKAAKLSLLQKGIKLEGVYFDILLASFLVNSSLVNASLGRIIREFLEREEPDSCAAKVVLAEELHARLSGLLKEQGLERLFYEIEMPLLEVLVDMQRFPISLDRKEMEKVLTRLRQELADTAEQIYSLAGTKFNLNSPKETAAVLYEKLKLPVFKKTKTSFSTNEETLHRLSAYHPVAEMILSYRRLNKIINTYIIPLKREAAKYGGRIFPNFSQVSAQTGRLVSHSPNLQSVPVRTETGRKVRRFFISSFPDGFILSSDYSQIELRVLAHLSQDKALRQAFVQGQDVHAYTAGLLFNTDASNVTASQRETAKKVNFAVIYGMGPHGLSRELDISFEEAKQFIDSYFKRYPGVKRYLDGVKKAAEEKGFVETMFGRRRYFPLLGKAKGAFHASLMRQAVNAPIQGSAAEIIKLAMIEVRKTFLRSRFKSRLMLQIHDELLFNVEKSELEDVIAAVKEVMENAFSLTVPLKVNIKYGRNWGDLKEIVEKEAE